MALGQFPEIEQTVLFGSRAQGNAQAGSDVDLALKGPSVTEQTVLRLQAILDDLPLPYFFDVVHYEEIQNENLIDHIDRVGRIIYPVESSTILGTVPS